MAACLKPRAPPAPIANPNITQVLQSPVYKEEAEVRIGINHAQLCQLLTTKACEFMREGQEVKVRRREEGIEDECDNPG